MAGTVAMGAAATFMLSALAIDVTDAALLGGMVLGGYAAFSTPGAVGGKKKAAGANGAVNSTNGTAVNGTNGTAVNGVNGTNGTNGTAVMEREEEAVTIGNKASAPGTQRGQGGASCSGGSARAAAAMPAAVAPPQAC